MPAHSLLALAAAAALLVGLAGCESTNLPPAATPKVGLEGDEQRLWAGARSQEEMLDASGFLARLPDAERYLDEVIAGLHPGPLPNDGRLRVRILVDPTLNAFSLPDGTIYVHTGLLANLANEAQVATVLGHELTHATHRHLVKQYRKMENSAAAMAYFTAGTAGIGGLLGAIGAASAVSGFSRELEREADLNGFRAMVAAGYDPAQSVAVFERLLAQSEKAAIKQPFFFGSHPRLDERVANFREFVSAMPPEQRKGRTGEAAYDARLWGVFLLNADAAQRAGDVAFARDCIERCLRLRPEDPAASLKLADVLRKSGSDADALGRYRSLVARHPDMAEAYRGVGLVLVRRGEGAAAADALRRYLSLAPSAPDREYIEALIK